MAEPIRLDRAAQQVWQGDREVPLTPMLFKLLTYLIAHAGEVVTKKQLLSDLWRIDWDTKSKSPDMHVSWLRKALRDDVKAPAYIATVHSEGYRFDPAMVAASLAPEGGYLLPLRVGRQAPHQTVYDAEDRMVAAGMTPQAAAWLVRAANGALEGAGADRG